MSFTVTALAVFDDGSGAGPALYAGGAFTTAGGQSANRIAKWDGQGWSALGSGMNGDVLSLTVFDDGSGGGPKLYAGGVFSQAGGVIARRVASWDGVAWSSLGSGILGGFVYALTVFDDGGGPALYAGGDFTTAGGLSVNSIARWNGSSWSALELGIGGTVLALTSFTEPGQAPVLVAGGHSFWAGGNASARNIAQWSGSKWSALGKGIGAESVSTDVHALTVFEDPSAGPVLIAGGEFQTAGDVSASSIAQWNGSAWSPVGAGMEGSVRALTLLDGGASLVAGGFFTVSASGDSHVARWACPAFATVPGCGRNPALLTPASASLALGQPFAMELAGTPDPSGLGVLVAGLPGFDAAGCGLAVPGLGELLLLPPPVQLDLAPSVGGKSALGATVPVQPGLVGVQVGFQGVNLAPSAPAPIELSNALTATIAP